MKNLSILGSQLALLFSLEIDYLRNAIGDIYNFPELSHWKREIPQGKNGSPDNMLRIRIATKFEHKLVRKDFLMIKKKLCLERAKNWKGLNKKKITQKKLYDLKISSFPFFLLY